MLLHFCRPMVQICPHLCCFLSILKTTPNISSLASFYSSRKNCTERLGASLYALITFRATPNAIQGRILKFLSGWWEGGPSLCRKSTWGYPFPKITRTLSPRYVTWIMHKRLMFAYTWRNQWSLAFCLLLSKQQTFRLTFSEIRSCALQSSCLTQPCHCY